jgi:hypothetical protein
MNPTISNAVSALANVVIAFGVLAAVYQVRITLRINKTNFEDTLSREYREIARNLPRDAMLGRPLTPMDVLNSLDDFLTYFDLSNEQIFLRQANRISKETWKYWCDGIRQNLQFPAFQTAWNMVKKDAAEDRFQELRKLESTNFVQDPRSWPLNR